MYLVSILVPVYKVENYIERCARSLFEQSYQEIEYVFIDDCCPDNSIKILEQLIEEYPQRKNMVKIIHHEKNKGLAAARNTAIEHARGLFLSHVDSDDYLEKNAIELLVEEQIKGDYDIVSGNAVQHFIDKDELIKEPICDNKDKWLKELLRYDNIYNHSIWRRIIRRTLYSEHNIKTIEGCNQGEDWQVMPKLAYYMKSFSTVDAVVYNYDCTNQNSHMSNLGKANVNLWKQDVGSIKEIVRFFNDKEIDYLNRAQDIALYTMNTYLHLSAKYGERDFFDFLVAEMKGYKSRYNTIGWNNLVKRNFRQCFTLMMAFYKTRSWVWGVLKDY